MRVVLAHGTWDLLHPGHVAHLEQAKAMGDYLVVGVTGDEYVDKGPGRPAVPAVDRKRAVEALRCVDIAVIDHHATPDRLIRALKPDIFVKGADYQGQDIPERAWVESYGGEVRFTNGDTMYHSSDWISVGSAQVHRSDTLGLLQGAGLGVRDLLAVLDQATDYRIHVVGDAILDEYVDGALIGPLTLHVQQRQRWRGGAYAVAHHARAAGAQVILSTPWGKEPRKTRYYADSGLVCQIDCVDNTPIPAQEVERLAQELRTRPADAVIFADYRHGVFHAESLPVLRAAIPAGALKVADSQVASRWGNIGDFRGFDLVTPNEREARWATGEQDLGPPVLAEDALHRYHFGHLLLTRGADGLSGTTRRGRAFDVPALAHTVVDPVGAGDALLAYATLGLLASQRLVVAAWLGSVAAAIACSRRGNAPVTATEVRVWLERL